MRPPARVFMCELRQERDSGRFTQAFGVYHDDYRRVDGRGGSPRRRYQSLAAQRARRSVFVPRGGVMTTIFYERDADLDAIASERIAVVGYGNQGRSWALNLRDSGCAPVMCVRRDDTREQADRRRLRSARRRGRQRRRHHLHPRARRRDRAAAARSRVRESCVIVASGYTLAFDRLDPPGDAGMVAPRMLGPEVRLCYEEGIGFITAVGVHRDATGRARERVLGDRAGDRRAAAGRDRDDGDAGGRARPRRRAGALARARPR